MHERQLHEDACFLTLTYEDKNLPPGGTVVPEHFRDFMKRYRRFVEPKKIRYFHCGEYGSQLQRPHYHALIFGHDFEDKTRWKTTPAGILFRSNDLEKLWPYGFASIGPVTFESAAYVARYCTKKITGDLAEGHYKGKHPEYVTMSRRPGIGARWFQKYQADVYPSDEVISRGMPAKPPRAYDKWLEKHSAAEFKRLKRERVLNALEPKRQIDSTPRRLADRETVTTAKLNLYKGSLDD